MSDRNRAPRWSRAAAILSIAFAIALVAGGMRNNPAAPLPHTVNIVSVIDTMHSTPWVGQIIDSWQESTPRAFCINSYAKWPGFIYLRHLMQVETLPPPPSCPAPTPLFLQLAQCPGEIADLGDAAFVIVQCAPHRFDWYQRGVDGAFRRAA